MNAKYTAHSDTQGLIKCISTLTTPPSFLRLPGDETLDQT